MAWKSIKRGKNTVPGYLWVDRSYVVRPHRRGSSWHCQHDNFRSQSRTDDIFARNTPENRESLAKLAKYLLEMGVKLWAFANISKIWSKNEWKIEDIYNIIRPDFHSYWMKSDFFEKFELISFTLVAKIQILAASLESFSEIFRTSRCSYCCYEHAQKFGKRFGLPM